MHIDHLLYFYILKKKNVSSILLSFVYLALIFQINIDMKKKKILFDLFILIKYCDQKIYFSFFSFPYPGIIVFYL